MRRYQLGPSDLASVQRGMDFLDGVLGFLPVFFELRGLKSRVAILGGFFDLLGEIFDGWPIRSDESEAPHVKRESCVEPFAPHLFDELPKVCCKPLPMRNDFGKL